MVPQVQDIDAAIEFVQSQQDEELWEELISHSLGSPPMVAALLDRIGRYTDPLSLLTRLPPNMPIPRLRDRLVSSRAVWRPSDPETSAKRRQESPRASSRIKRTILVDLEWDVF